MHREMSHKIITVKTWLAAGRLTKGKNSGIKRYTVDR